MKDNEPWFRPKLYGYGAGLPIHWKGWVLGVAYAVSLLGAPYALERALGYPPDFATRLIVVVALTVPFIWIVKRKTKGGWRWRRGEEEN